MGGNLVVVTKDLIPVVHDAPARPPVPTAIRHAPRIGERRGEERLGSRGAPIHEEGSAGRIGEADAAHVHRRGHGCCGARVGGVGHGPGVVPDAHVQPEPAQRGELGDQAADVGVALDGLRAAACGVAAAGVQTGGQERDLLVEGAGGGGEVALVVGDVRRVGLVAEVVGEGEDAGCLGGHGASVRPHRGLAARPPTSYNSRRGGNQSPRSGLA